MWFDLIPNMPKHRLIALMGRYGETVKRERSFSGLFSAV